MQQVMEGYRLSPRQRQLWPLHGAAGAWATLAVRGEPDAQGVRRALEGAVERNEILRTRFVREPRSGVPLQVIGDALVEWEEDEDWRGASEGEVEARLAVRMEAALRRPFADDGAPLRAALARTGDAELLLLVHAPALAADAETMRLLPAELARAYADGFDAGDVLQYADVSEWQLENAASEDAAEGRRFWQARAVDGDLGLPGEVPAGAWDPRVVRVAAAPGLLPGLAAAATRLEVPLADLLLASFLTLLHRVTGRGEVAAAAAFDGRGFDEMRLAPGPFGRFLPVPARLSPELSVREVACDVARFVEDARPWQDFYPDGDSLPARVAFTWHGAVEEAEAGGLAFGVREAWVAAERFALSLACEADAGGLGLRAIFDAGALPREAAERVVEGYHTLLAALAAHPDARVGELDAVGPLGRRRLLERLAPGPRTPAAGTVVEWIEAQAARTPAHVALVAGDATLTYAELVERVRRRAARLREQGVGAESRVAVVGERAAETLVSILAVMWAGGAYVPLDPAYPAERLRFVLEDAGVSLVVAAGAAALAAREGGHAVLDPTESDGNGAPAAGAVPAPPEPRTLAYVIYTSGTTGRPKGIGVEHAALAQYVGAVSATLALPAGAAWAMVSTFAADLGNTMLFPALCGGGTLHLVSESCATDPEAWGAYAARHAIDALKIVPSHLRLLLDAERPERALPRARLVLGGEASDRALVDRVRELAPGCRVFNHYGPTETTVGVVAGEVAAGGAGAPPLGRPLAGVRLYVVDERGRLAPEGAAGELYAGGGSVARGYVNRPALTAGRFVPDSFGGEPGARLYRTGDRVRWLADGRLEFLGRTDDQVKVAGNRVEPAEAASVLAGHPSVAECRVIAAPHREQMRLVAYVVARGEQAAPAELRAFLAERLPEPLIPSVFVHLARFPVTPNGKLDVAALPVAGAAAGGGRAPSTPLEERLARLWADVLGVSVVGADDDFFLLGGNSFMAVRLMSRIHREFGSQLPLAALVAAGTVERIAVLLGSGGAPAHQHVVPLAGGGSGEAPLFCIHPGSGTVLCYNAMARHLGPSVPVLGVQALDFEVDRPALTSIPEMAARYVDEIRRIHPGPVRLAGWSFGGLVAFEMARQLHARGEAPERLILFDTRLPITAPALARVDPVFHRLSMLFDPRILVSADGTRAVTRAEVEGLPVDAQLDLVARRTGTPRERLIPAQIPPDRLDRYVELRMARTAAILSYPWAPYDGAITLFRAVEPDFDIPFPELEAAYREAAGTPDYGWGRLSPHPVEVVAVPGTHTGMFDEPHVGTLARELEHCLAAATAST